MSDQNERSVASAGSLANAHSARQDAEAKIIVDGIAQIMRIASEPDWIPVTQRLPDDETELLVAFEDRSLGVAFAVFHHIDENDGPKWTDGNGNELKQPTHWMPLPAPPTDAK